jgi:hypothetical protein
MNTTDKAYLREIVRNITKAIFNGKSYFIYDCYRFDIKDHESSFQFGDRECRNLGIVPPPELTYAITPAWTIYYIPKCSDVRKIEFEKHIASYRLANTVVYKILPKIDYKIRVLVNTEEVEKILSVLE